MNTSSEFSLPTAIQNWREKLIKSGAFTFDNLEELEAHLQDGIEIYREKTTLEEAFELALKDLGDPAVLIQGYQKENQALIWRNYFWVIALSSFVWWILFGVLHKGIGRLFFSQIDGWLQFISLAIGVICVSTFIYAVFLSKTKIFKVLNGISHSHLKTPAFIFLLLLLLPLRYLVDASSHWILPGTGLSLVGTYGVLIMSLYGLLYIVPILVLARELWKYSQNRSNRFEDNIRSIVKICFLSGAFIAAIFHNAFEIFSLGGILLLEGLGFELSVEMSMLFSGSFVILLFFAAILSVYHFPKKSLSQIKNRYDSNFWYKILFILSVPGFSLIKSLLKGTVVMTTHANVLGSFYSIETKMILGLEIFLVVLFVAWSYRSLRNQQVIAWN